MNSKFDAMFPFHPLGYLRHWLVTGPKGVPYAGPIRDENRLRQDALDFSQVVPPRGARLGAKGPLGEPWRFYYPGQNIFVEHSDFWVRPTVLDSYAYTEIEVEREGPVAARLWVAGAADLWINDVHVARLNVPRYMYPDFQPVTLPLKSGLNRLCVRLQCVAIRDTRILFGLQMIDATVGMVVCPPDSSFLGGAAKWLDEVKFKNNKLFSENPASADAEIVLSDDSSLAWPTGSREFSLEEIRPFQFKIKTVVEDQVLVRQFEIPGNRQPLPHGVPTDLRRAHLEHIAAAPDDGFSPGVNYSHLPLLARRVLGQTSEIDALAFPTLIRVIDERHDCADFVLAVLLRIAWLGLATLAEAAEIKRAALAFRYWYDEAGHDAMCFWSENHSLLFHGCQAMAGQLYSDAIFSASGRTGLEQIKVGQQRIAAWLDKIEPQGLAEFLSGTYIPITVGALLNVVDFSGDVELSRRAAAQIDRIFADLADHTFQGLIVGPQGRVYRGVLYPEEAGTQALLSYATSEAVPDFSRRGPKPKEKSGDWAVFLATSKIYQPPEGLGKRMRQSLSKRYRQADAEIILHKTPDYVLTSLAVPSLLHEGGLRPGMAGYQQHLWQATLGVGCHVFVTHPGGSYDVDKSPRPGYWFGNGVLPVVRQRDEILQAIYDIPDGSPSVSSRAYSVHPVPFAHIHWPSDAFDHQEHCGQWLFGRKGDGCIGIWCSETLKPHDEVLTGRELRANACRTAWVAICGGGSEHSSFASFIESCVARAPEFDKARFVLQMKDEEPLSWPERK